MLFREKIKRFITDESAVLDRPIRKTEDVGHNARRHRISGYLPFLSFDPDKNLIFSSDRKGNAALGIMMTAATPLAWANAGLLRELRAALAVNLPRGSFIQFLRFDVPDVSRLTDLYFSARMESSALLAATNPTVADMVESSADHTYRFIDSLTNRPVFLGNELRATEQMLIATLNIPSPQMPDEKFIESVQHKIDSFMAAVPSLNLTKAPAQEFVAVWRRFLHYFSPWDTITNDQELVREQIAAPGDAIIDRGEGGVECLSGLNDPDTWITPLCLKEYGNQIQFGALDALLGDWHGMKSGSPDPILWSWTARVPDQNDKRNWLKKKAALLNYQAYGPMQRFVPSLRYRKEGMDNLVAYVEGEGDALLEVALNAFVFSRSRDDAIHSVPTFQSHCQSSGFDFRVDDLIPIPVLLNSLPLFPSEESIAFSYRFKSLSTTQASTVLPIFGDWLGPGVQGDLAVPGAGTLFFSRRGHPALIDIYSSNGNYNFLISGSAGSGKSVAAQKILNDQMDMGAQAWVIEIGRSFEKLCKVRKGTHITFSDTSRLGMNPYSMVEDFDDELEELAAIHAAMISPEDGLPAEDMAYLDEAIRSVYSEKGNKATPTDTYQFLNAQKSERQQMLARMMYNYTFDGAYGEIFTGTSTVDLTDRFTVLELEDLQGKKGLRSVILLQLMFAIEREMYRKGNRDTRRIIFVDEASELLKINSAATFLDGAYRRARKHKGSIGIGIQNVSDLFLSKSTEVIASQAEHRFLLHQEPESIARAADRKEISLDGYGLQLLQSLRKAGGFSEMVIASNGGVGAFRLVLDPYTLALLKSSGKAKTQVLSDIEGGMSADKALRRFLDQENPGWEKLYPQPDRRPIPNIV
jgi:conjugal transfer ATP-binding protein TraC